MAPAAVRAVCAAYVSFAREHPVLVAALQAAVDANASAGTDPPIGPD